MKKTLVIYILLFATYSSAQETPFIDSLKKFIASAPDDSSKVKALYKLGQQYELFKSKEHISHFISALNLSKKINYESNRAAIYRSLVTMLFYRGSYALGMEYGIEGMKFIQMKGKPEEQFYLHTMLGNLCSKQGQYEQAKGYYNQLLKYHSQNHDQVNYAITLMNIAVSEIDQKNYDSAYWHLEKSEIILKRNNKQSFAANCVLGMAEALLAKGDLMPAAERANESLGMYQIIKEGHGIANCNYVLGLIEQKGGDHLRAIHYFDAALKLSDSLNIFNVKKDCFNSLATEYALINDHESAYKYSKLFKLYDDSLGIEEQKGKMLELEVKYDISKKEHLLLEQEMEIDSKNKQRNFLLLGIAGIIALLVISYRAYKQKKESSEIIAKQKEMVEDKQKEILDSINYAKRIQSAILAREEDIKKYLPQSFLLYKPKDIVAGDFYFFEVNETHIFYAAADCTGHGVPGALMSVVCSNSLTRCVKEFGLNDPGKILDKTRILVVETLRKSGEEVKDGMDISLLVISRKTGKATWAGANNPLWIVRNGVLEEVVADKQPIGLFENEKPFTSHPLVLNNGDMLYLFTDGYADQFGGPKGKKFKYKQFKEALVEVYSHEPAYQAKILEEKFINWKAKLEQVDDICVIGIKL